MRNTEDYRDQVQARYDLAVRRIEELAAVADNPFEHTGELVAKQNELEQLTAQLRIEASGPDAGAAAAEAGERMEAMGRKPGYSLPLNSSPALLRVGAVVAVLSAPAVSVRPSLRSQSRHTDRTTVKSLRG